QQAERPPTRTVVPRLIDLGVAHGVIAHGFDRSETGFKRGLSRATPMPHPPQGELSARISGARRSGAGQRSARVEPTRADTSSIESDTRRQRRYAVTSNPPWRPAPIAKRRAPSWLSPESCVALPSANSLASACPIGSSIPSQADRRSLRTQFGGNAAMTRPS